MGGKFQIGDYVRLGDVAAKSMHGRKGHVVGFDGILVKVELDNPPPRSLVDHYHAAEQDLHLIEAVNGRSAREARHDNMINQRIDARREK